MRILLAGDSWGLGVWGHLGNMYTLKHPGIDHFMRLDNHDVVNISIAGAVNSQIVESINIQLSKDDKFDRIFYIQTDPIRDIPKYRVPLKGNQHEFYRTKWFDDYAHLRKMMDKVLDDTYKKLNSFGHKIYVLAGCSTVNQELLSKYDNLVCAIPSILKFLEPSIDNPEIWTDPLWLQKLNKKWKWDLDTLDKILEQERLTRKIPVKCSHFKDDHAHPDLSGYDKVYQYLKKNYLDIDITHKNIV